MNARDASHHTQSGTSRRSFVKGAAMLGAAGALQSKTAFAESAASSYSLPEKWDRETDVLVIGAGCGMAAAIKTAEAGCDTIVIEKSDHTGGFWLASGGGCTMGGNNIVQQEAGVEDDLDAWYEAEMAACEYRGNAEIMRVLCERGAETVKWMADLGLVWGPLSAGMLGGDVERGLWPYSNPDLYVGGFDTGKNAGICWTQVWEHRLVELGVPILLNHRMTRLFRDGDGPVVGAEVETSDGIVNIKARKAVVVATGSWTDNDRMVAAYDPRAAGAFCYGDGGSPATGIMYNEETGDGQIAGAAVGGILTDMSFVSYLWVWFGLTQFWSWGPEPLDWSDNSNWERGKTLGTDLLYKHGIIVKNDGKRYINENEGIYPESPYETDHPENPERHWTKTFLELPQPRNVWAIVDAPMAEKVQWPVEEIMNPDPCTGSLLDPTCVAYADTLEELAEKMGVPADELVKTVETYNGYVETGVDEEFGRQEMPAKIETGPFYAARASLIRHTGRNGLRVNTKSQVVDGSAMMPTDIVSIDDEPVIPHLYACGECGNSLGYRRTHNSLGHYATAAIIAGENAALEEA